MKLDMIEEIRNLNILINKKLFSVLNFELTPVQLIIIHLLINSPNRKLSQSEIINKTKLGKSSITSILQTMEKNNLINRNNSLSSNKLLQVSLTDYGTKIYSRFSNEIKNINNILKRDIPKEKLDVFKEVLKLLNQNISNKGEKYDKNI